MPRTEGAQCLLEIRETLVYLLGEWNAVTVRLIMTAQGSRILVVHRDRAVSQALMNSIENAFGDDDRVAIACGTTDEVCTFAGRYRPDVIVLNASCFEFPSFLTCLRALPQSARILACGLRNCGAEILAAIRAGAAACETIDGSLGDLIQQIKALCDGEMICPPKVAGMLYREVAAHSPRETRSEEGFVPQLTGRERQIVSLIEHGLSNKEIANELSIGLQTVKNHVHNILEKLQVRRRAEAARYARENGLLIDRHGHGSHGLSPRPRRAP